MKKKKNKINLKILNKSYFPNIKNRVFHKLSKNINKFYSFEDYGNLISIY